ncbi:hypothetical protein B0H63DRAFT_446407 [Podospora didyma]|uniref:Galactose oxidase n=1 Tax=Podospora didyma TaxID=330526 RepID=A0AAE0U467_9PEZI|nr:hypothetical protein B0H63DRAFT_446407 [Podospora didyma]
MLGQSTATAAGNALRSSLSLLSSPSTAAGPARRLAAWVALAAVLATQAVAAAAADELPYIPTTVLLSSGSDVRTPSNTGDVAYIFAPNAAGSVDLLSVNISSTLSAASFKTQTLTSGVPFFPAGSRTTTFTPSLLDNGTITALAGDCSVATNTSLWTYSGASSSWTRHVTTLSTSSDFSQGGPYFLGGSLSFSEQLAPAMSDPVHYIYGGMCPGANASSSAWQSSAAYSNRMLRVSRSSPSSPQAPFTVDTTRSARSPTAAAGFSFTELTPALSNRSGVVNQQTSHVLIGGHTKQAFINMSMAAVWSLPEESWNFVTIREPAAATRSGTDLAVKDTATATAVDSRSGHTAVLSEDGSSLIILGGWVGDVSQAAKPQLAIVKIGASFDDWEWSIPPRQPSGSGVYGHGVALLPGNVMMVYGGYDIVPSTTMKRQVAGGSGRQLFFNITSLSWSDEYTNPALGEGKSGGSGGGSTHGGEGGGGASDTTANDNDSSPASQNKQIGLGVGLGVGILVLLLLAGLGICLRRRQKRRREQRNEALHGLSQGMINGSLPRQHNSTGDDDEDDDVMLERNGMGGAGGIFPWNATSAQTWYTGGADPYASSRRSLGYETLRGASKSSPSLYLPPPPLAASSSSGRPRGGAARGLYVPTTGNGNGSGYDGFLMPPRSSNNRIEPIYEEADEDGDLSMAAAAVAHIGPEKDELLDDPFMTPTTGTDSPSPQQHYFPPPLGLKNNEKSPPQGQDPEVQGWVSDVDAADAVLSAKISRHGSTTTTPPAGLRGAVIGSGGPTTPTRHQSGGRTSPSRRPSVRSAAEHDDTARTGSNLSERSAFSFVQGAERAASHFRAAFGTVPAVVPVSSSSSSDGGRLGSSSGSSSHTFSTAKSNFATLQAEGPSLLLGGGNHNNTTTTKDDEEYEYINDVPGSPSKSKPRRSWFGSLRRVFSTGASTSGSSAGGTSSRGVSPTHEGLLAGEGGDYEKRASTGALLLQRRKQGREAWETGVHTLASPSSSSRRERDEHQEDDDDWDIEKAVEQRLVQVMFTVPKERLRVVNAEVQEEVAVVVDPDSDDYDDDDDDDDYRPHDEELEMTTALTPPKTADSDKGTATKGSLSGSGKQPETAETEKGEEQQHQEEEQETAAEAARMALSPDSGSLRTASITTTATMNLGVAEAVRMERASPAHAAKTRVLRMVESIESRSSDNSPCPSPTRG